MVSIHRFAVSKQEYSTKYPPKLHGTGSYPPFLNGWHLNILLAARRLPLNAPYLWMAIMAYSEQVGTYIQHPGFIGDIYFL